MTPVDAGRRGKKRKRRRFRWADRDTYLSLFWLAVGFAAGTFHAAGGPR